jgi:hypothetical protein
MGASRCIDQLGRDPQAAAILLDGAREHIADVEPDAERCCVLDGSQRGGGIVPDDVELAEPARSVTMSWMMPWESGRVKASSRMASNGSTAMEAFGPRKATASGHRKSPAMAKTVASATIAIQPRRAIRGDRVIGMGTSAGPNADGSAPVNT